MDETHTASKKSNPAEKEEKEVEEEAADLIT